MIARLLWLLTTLGVIFGERATGSVECKKESFLCGVLGIDYTYARSLTKMVRCILAVRALLPRIKDFVPERRPGRRT